MIIAVGIRISYLN